MKYKIPKDLLYEVEDMYNNSKHKYFKKGYDKIALKVIELLINVINRMNIVREYKVKRNMINETVFENLEMNVVDLSNIRNLITVYMENAKIINTTSINKTKICNRFLRLLKNIDSYHDMLSTYLKNLRYKGHKLESKIRTNN
jgi:hypothetical protein